MYLGPILERKRQTWAGAGQPALPGGRPTPTEPDRFRSALVKDTVAVIAEFKPCSPSKGELRPVTDALPLTRSYAAAGASALSVLADEPFFGGSPALVRTVATDPLGALPVLYKDFLVDVRQVQLAQDSGADAVLLIVRAVDDTELRDISQAARELGLDVVHECFNEVDIERALTVDASIVGINNRDLETFQVDLGISTRLSALVPAGVVTVSESGLSDAADVAVIADAGFDACLVGESLLGATDLPALLGAMSAVRKGVRA